ncbi:hypothetical protein AAZX31_01G186800 [Glycine max]
MELIILAFIFTFLFIFIMVALLRFVIVHFHISTFRLPFVHTDIEWPQPTPIADSIDYVANSTNSIVDSTNTVVDAFSTTSSPPMFEPRIIAVGERISAWEQCSNNPYEDFRQSIQELIEVYPELANSNNMNMLFFQYLEYNPESMHPYIVRAFTDFFFDLTLQGVV